MKQSKLLLPTYRDAPRDADVVSQQLMMRGGMIQKVAAGIYDYLPLALRSIRKFENIVREELARDGAQELLMPTVQPGELWQESGRWQFYGRELLRFKDRKGADFCLGPTHEEIVTDIVRKIVKSYKQLPINLFQVQTKFRDEIRPRFGLMRGREFIMKDGYSFHVDDADADREYWRMFEAYKRIFTRLGVKFRPVEADSGAIGGSFTHEFHVLAGSGEDAILSCTACEYTSNAEKTEAPAHSVSPISSEPVLDLQQAHFHTPGIVRWRSRRRRFRTPSTTACRWITRRSSISIAPRRATTTWDVGLVLRSDHEPNTVKMKNLIGADSLDLVPLEEAERRAGTKSGFIGPVEFDVPDVCRQEPRGRVQPDVRREQGGLSPLRLQARSRSEGVQGIPRSAAGEGRRSHARAAGRARSKRSAASKWGRSSSSGTKYSVAMNCVYLDESGTERPMVMGCYGIGITRTIAAVIEQNYDADGVIWPWPVAPYHVHLVSLDSAKPEIAAVANQIEADLEGAGFEVLHDDREGLSPGVKFKDADLLGMPLRLTVGAKGLKDGVVELRDRRTKEVVKMKPEDVVAAWCQKIASGWN